MEKTLVLIKPDAVKRNLIGKIIEKYESCGLSIAAIKMEQITSDFAAQHYQEHVGKPFYDGLVDFITSSPLCAMVLQGDNAIKKVREINGATNPEEADEGTIRRLYAESKSLNCVHASDSAESAAREVNLWFGY